MHLFRLKSALFGIVAGLALAGSVAHADSSATPRQSGLTALKTALNLTAAQTTAFDALWTAQQAREVATRIYAQTALANVATMTLPQKLDAAISIDAREQSDFTAFAASLKSFYATLNATQQGVMNTKFPIGLGAGHGPGH